MFCSKCGKPASENSLFCTYCGTPMTEAQPESVHSEEMPAPVTAGAAYAADSAAQAQPAFSETANAAPESAEPASPAAGSIPMTSAPAAPVPEKYYTFGHIAMCLAAVAVMAIVAGVFAGLYFSVV